MKRLLEHAEKNVPLYRETWKAKHVRVGDIERYEDLVCLPILTKNDVREHADALMAIDQRKEHLIVHETGGSTGTPLRFYYDQPTEIARRVSLRRWEKYAGMQDANERLFYMGRPGFDLINDKHRWGDHGEQYLGDYFALTRRGAMATTNLTDAVLCGYCDLIEKYRPPFLKGYSSGLYLLAEYCLRTGRNWDFIIAVMASSDMVTPKQRAITQQAWNCEVFDRYGMGEEIAAAAECREHNGYHIDMVRCLVEVVNEAGQHLTDAPGEVIGTCLTNYAMPLIRYAVGDRASLTEHICRCGIESMMLATVEGRSAEVLKTRKGRQVSASALGLMVMGIDCIKEAQFVVTSPSSLIVHVVRSTGYKTSDEILFLRRLQSQLDDSMSVQIHYVDHIPRQPNGKFRLVISEMDAKKPRE